MGISTKRAKRVVQQRTIQYPGHPGHGNDGVTVMSDDPDIAVVWDPNTNHIMTVIWRTQEDYVR